LLLVNKTKAPNNRLEEIGICQNILALVEPVDNRHMRNNPFRYKI